MTDRADDIVVEILRSVQADLAQLKNGVSDLKSEMHGLRTQVNSFQADILRVEGRIAGIEIEIDRIKTRLELHDA